MSKHHASGALGLGLGFDLVWDSAEAREKGRATPRLFRSLGLVMERRLADLLDLGGGERPAGLIGADLGVDDCAGLGVVMLGEIRDERATRDALGLLFSSSSSNVRLRLVELGSMFSESMKIVFLGLLMPFRERTGSRVRLAGAADPTMDHNVPFC